MHLSPAWHTRIHFKDAGMSPICNLRFKDIPINCGRSVMSASKPTFCPANVTEFSVAASRFGGEAECDFMTRNHLETAIQAL